MPRALTRKAAVPPGGSLAPDGAIATLVRANAAGVASVNADAPDPGQSVAEHYVGLEAERARLSRAWQDVETQLFRTPGWLSLAEAEQAASPAAAQLEEIEAQADLLEQQQALLLPLLKTTSACTRAGMFARLDALLTVLDPHDEDARQLLQSCQADLGRLWR